MKITRFFKILISPVERMQGAAPVTEQRTPDSLISVAQQSFAVRDDVFAGVHPGPPQVPHSATQHTSKDVDCTPAIPPVHWAAVCRKK